VQRQLLVLEVLAPQRQAGALGGMRGERVEQAAGPELHVADERVGVLGQRHQPRARPLRQGLGQGDDLVPEHARHEPFAALLARRV
jgi:hypothetical protein